MNSNKLSNRRKLNKVTNFLCGNKYSCIRWIDETNHHDIFYSFNDELSSDGYFDFDVSYSKHNLSFRYKISFVPSDFIAYYIDLVEFYIDLAQKSVYFVDDTNKPNIIVTCELPHVYYLYTNIIGNILYNFHNKDKGIKALFEQYNKELRQIIKQWNEYIMGSDRLFNFMAPGLSDRDLKYIERHKYSWFNVLLILYMIRVSGMNVDGTTESLINIFDTMNVKVDTDGNNYEIVALISISQLIDFMKNINNGINEIVSHDVELLFQSRPDIIINRLPKFGKKEKANSDVTTNQ